MFMLSYNAYMLPLGGSITSMDIDVSRTRCEGTACWLIKLDSKASLKIQEDVLFITNKNITGTMGKYVILICN